jgi:Asp-tRNA(Asn)/Glu-tRNA(Gln) amidotransferase A subunit family amidase
MSLEAPRTATFGDRSPFGISFTGMGFSEPRLIELGYAFEQATSRRMAPPAFP